MRRTVRLIEETAGDPALDTAVSRTILERVAAGELAETLRMYRPQPNVAFGGQDAVAPGYDEAVRRARERGFEAIERLAGGRAAVFHEDTVAFAWAIPAPSLREGIRERFLEVTEVMVDGLTRLGVDARPGEVSGEYCPGEFSVNARGAHKLMGVGQRVIRGGAHIGGVVVVGGAQRIRDVLLAVYDAMAFPWNPDTTGSIEAEIGAIDFNEAVGSLKEAFGARLTLEEAGLDHDVVDVARSRRSAFTAPG